MRIAFLCKRRYMGKDVILDRYARLYEIPFQLAGLGHDVLALCLSYQTDSKNGSWDHETRAGTLHWESYSLGALRVPSLLAYPIRTIRRVSSFAPDIIIAASDIPHVVLGAWLALRLKVPFIADLYDNFEGFGQAKIPGMKSALRRAVRNADMVVTTSEPLRTFVIDEYRARGEVVAMPSSIDKAVFHARDRITSRRKFNLPENVKLIGTAGGLHRDKGITALYRAWEMLKHKHLDTHLVLAGPLEPNLAMPTGDRVHYLGALPHSTVADLFCALDVGVMCILETSFGRYCFPQKAYEMLACDLPVVAADVGAMHELLNAYPQCLFRPDDAEDLAAKLNMQLNKAITPQVPIDDWRTLVAKLEPTMKKIVADTQFS